MDTSHAEAPLMVQDITWTSSIKISFFYSDQFPRLGNMVVTQCVQHTVSDIISSKCPKTEELGWDSHIPDWTMIFLLLSTSGLIIAGSKHYSNISKLWDKASRGGVQNMQIFTWTNIFILSKYRLLITDNTDKDYSIGLSHQTNEITVPSDWFKY